MFIKMPDYDIYIENQGLKDLQGHIQSVYHGHVIYVITDEHVEKLYAGKLKEALPNFQLFFVVVKPGEHSKSFETYQQVIHELIEKKIKRDHLIIALGGGVVGDLAGFVSASLYRGIAFIQIPTTLLAMVDSSIGGKVGIDLPEGKNLVGAFYNPKFVYVDPTFLDTLEPRDYRNGLAEMIKAGLIGDKKLYHDLLDHEKVSEDEIIMAIQVKRSVVLLDPYDHKERMYLNFGHTYGHAIEKKFNYETYLHGEAVSYGMLLALELGVKLGETHQALYNEVKELLIKRNLVKEPLLKAEDFRDFIMNDKKNLKDGLHFILVSKPGEANIHILKVGEL